MNKKELFGEFLTDQKLGQFLKENFKEKFIYNKKVSGSKSLCRPDYRNDKLKLIIEFDGVRHYTETKVILRDIEKNIEYIKLGYKIIHIPYYFQLTKETIKMWFNLDIKNFKQVFPNGFINYRATTPADFCELGIKRFLYDLYSCPEKVYNELIQSLLNKINDNYNIYSLLPKSLFNILKLNHKQFKEKYKFKEFYTQL